MSLILENAIKKLTNVVNVSAGLAHPLDEDRAKELFKALYSHGVPLDYNDVYSLALRNSWIASDAKGLAKLAERIGAGRRVQIKNPRNWGEPTVLKIISELEEL